MCHELFRQKRCTSLMLSSLGQKIFHRSGSLFELTEEQKGFVYGIIDGKVEGDVEEGLYRLRYPTGKSRFPNTVVTVSLVKVTKRQLF